MRRNAIRWTIAAGIGGTLVMIGLNAGSATAYERYQDGCNASPCHGDFTGDQSPAGTVFPNGNKHTMHRSNSYMAADCDLCHSSNDSNNPFIGMSDGTDLTPGRGCTGCHGREYPEAGGGDFESAGLRLHHFNNDVTICAVCHGDDPTPLPEDVPPPYYGSPDTDANDPCNASGLEDWSIGDGLGLDNDGDGLYDGDDPDCGLPMGACCFADGVCLEQTADDCGNAGGIYTGDDTSCVPNDCPQPPATGACCFADGSCSVQTAADCGNAGGAYTGDDTSCMPNECPQPPDCPADLDGNLEVDFQDLLAVLAGWDCTDCPADIDGNGIADFQDLLILLAAWGPCP